MEKFLVTRLYLGSLFALSATNQPSPVLGMCKLKCLLFKVVIAESLWAAVNCNGRNNFTVL